MELTKGIVFGVQAYKSKSFILKIYTQDFGVKTFFLNSTLSKKGKRSGLIQLFQKVEVSSKKFQKDLVSISEINPSNHFENIGLSMVHNGIVYFLAEVLQQSFQFEEKNEDLYQFLSHAVDALDQTETPKNFHIWFLLRLSKYLGFAPSEEEVIRYFDLKESMFSLAKPKHEYYLQEETANKLHLIYSKPFLDAEDVILSKGQRKALIDALITLYQIHQEKVKQFKTLDVLYEVFN